jgi:hypothetical protein
MKHLSKHKSTTYIFVYVLGYREQARFANDLSIGESDDRHSDKAFGPVIINHYCSNFRQNH